MIRKFALLCVGLCFTPLVLSADCDINSVNEKLSNQAAYSDFVQTKTIKTLSRPLVSKGQIWVGPNEELVWQLIMPIKSTMVLHQDGVRQYNKHDELQSEQNHAVIAELSKVFLALLAGNMQQLQSMLSFQLFCGGNGELQKAKSVTDASENSTWKLVLKPKTKNISELMTEIVVSGASRVETIRFTETRGDSTEIHLTPKHIDASKIFDKYFVQANSSSVNTSASKE